MLDYAGLSPDRAQELHDDELARHDEVLESLRARVRSTGGDPAFLDGSRESLRDLWRWYLRWYDAGHAEAPGPLPPWYTRGDLPQEVDLPDTLFAVADEMGHYLDEVALRVAPGAHWRLVGERGGVRFEDFQKTGVALGEDDLVGPDVAWVMCLRVRRGRNREDDALLAVVDRRLAHLGV